MYEVGYQSQSRDVKGSTVVFLMIIVRPFWVPPFSSSFASAKSTSSSAKSKLKCTSQVSFPHQTRFIGYCQKVIDEKRLSVSLSGPMPPIIVLWGFKASTLPRLELALLRNGKDGMRRNFLPVKNRLGICYRISAKVNFDDRAVYTLAMSQERKGFRRLSLKGLWRVRNCGSGIEVTRILNGGPQLELENFGELSGPDTTIGETSSRKEKEQGTSDHDQRLVNLAIHNIDHKDLHAVFLPVVFSRGFEVGRHDGEASKPLGHSSKGAMNICFQNEFVNDREKKGLTQRGLYTLSTPFMLRSSWVSHAKISFGFAQGLLVLDRKRFEFWQGV
ncbi:hypothetical protein L218DRAFT_947247 [Marasmius fiardii PR-910]|nr:hypothetical protein L218DRAFT_947247 [Marasmius fiardii PR-910]